MPKKTCFSVLFLFSFIVFSCASLQPGYEKPVVSITSFKAIPGQSIVPHFEIGLHIVNPNRTELNLLGISYSIYLEGHKVITGVSNQLPEIQAYGEGDVVLNASVDIFSSIGFFKDLIQNQNQEKIAYSLKAKLDAGTLHPLIHVTKEGEISLIQKNQNP